MTVRFRSVLNRLGGFAPLALLPLAGCELWPNEKGYPYTTVDPISDFGWHTQELYATITYVVVIVFVLVSLLLAYTLLRYRDDGRPGLPEQIHGNTQLEIGWTLLPIFIVLMLVIPTIRTIFVIADAPPPGALGEDGQLLVDAKGAVAKPTVEIRVTGRRWWWDFQYPREGIRTGNQFAIPDDRPVELLVTSDTVIHSFWAPRIGGKRDAVPGRVNRIWFQITKDADVAPGTIEHVRGECAEYCGEAHALMRFEVLVLDGDDYDRWVKEYQTGPVFADAAVKDAGEAAFLGAGCVGCHAVKGNPAANGTQGPELTFFGDRRWLAAGVHDMYPGGTKDEGQARALLTQWITNPNSLKPGTTRQANPSRHLDGMNIPVDASDDGILQPEELAPEKVDAIVSYLLAQKSSFPLVNAAEPNDGAAAANP